MSPQATQKKALLEFNAFVDKLRSKGVNVIVVPDTKEPDTPDSIFPNNWVSFHRDGGIGLYLCVLKRRTEREDIFDILVDDYGFYRADI